MEDTRIQELEAKVAELTALVARLAAATEATAAASARVTPLAAVVGDAASAAPLADPASDAEPAARTSSRRRMLKLAGVAAAGTAVVLVGSNASPAAANDPDDLTLGATKTTAGLTQGHSSSTLAGANAFVFQVGSSFNNTGTFFPAALGGWSGEPGMPNGIYGYTSESTGAGIVGFGDGANSVGVRARGGQATLHLIPNGAAGPARADAHALGEIIEDAAGALWLNVAAGTPGTWRKLAGPNTAGAFHPISQVRIYDSRAPLQVNRGKLATGANRVVSVANSIVAATGVANADNIVPAGVTAVTGNITVTNTTGALGGFLTIMPGDANVLIGSSVNWFGPDQNIANSFIAKLDASRQLKIFAGGAPAPDTDVIVDITGYYL